MRRSCAESGSSEIGTNSGYSDEERRAQLMADLTAMAFLCDLTRVKSSAKGTGNVLDNSAIVFTNEAGHGRQLNDAMTANATHSVENMMLLVAGRAGGLRPGRHIATTGAHPARVLLSAMRGAGFAGDMLGEVSGHLPDLFG